VKCQKLLGFTHYTVWNLGALTLSHSGSEECSGTTRLVLPRGRAAVQLVGQNIRCLLCFGVLASFRSLDPPIRQNSPSLRKWHQRRQICPQTSLSRSSSSTSRVGANSRSRPQPQERCGMSDQKRAMSGVRSRSASAPLQGS
jgi:hypothetical protein